MEQAEAERIATEYARQQGYTVDDYVIGDVQQEDSRFWILFEGKSKRPGDHFSVDVDAAAGQATGLMPGR
jgi:hypothetical protein